MNSKSLQAKFPEVYREFFSKCPIVVSAPLSFFWAGEYAIHDRGLTLAQKLPLRVFVGLEPTESSKLIFGNRIEFYSFKQNFIKKDESDISHYQIGLEPFMEEYREVNGFKIHILAENLSWLGTNTSGATAIALAIALDLANKKINLDFVKRLSETLYIPGSNDKRLETILRTASQIEKQLNGNLTGGAGSFASLINQSLVISPGTEKTEYSFPSTKNWPIDFILLYTYEENNPILITPQVFKNPIWPPSSKILAYLSKRIAKILGQLFGGDYSQAKIAELFTLINQYHQTLSLLGLTTPTMDRISSYIKQFVEQQHFYTGFGIRMLGAGGGGNLLITMPRYFLYDELDSFLKALRKHTSYIGIDYNFISWLDGSEERGLLIEQHLAEGIYSKFISEGSISLKNFVKEGAVQTEITSLEGFEKEKPKIDLLLDAIENGIYIRGEKLTSKEIPSSSATVEILSILLDNLGKSISNSQLPESSYSKDRNEMQSKIISPLVKIIENKTKKRLPLKISGGLVEFRIKLDPSNLDIRILNKVF